MEFREVYCRGGNLERLRCGNCNLERFTVEMWMWNLERLLQMCGIWRGLQ